MRATTQKRFRSLLEGLEDRRLMSTVNVTTFGVKPGSGFDQSSAIQTAINSIKSGDTLYFPTGTYKLSHYVTINGDKSLIGDGAQKSVFVGNSPDGEQIYVKGDNVSITQMGFNGGGVFLDHPGGGYNTGITIDNDEFELNTVGQRPNGIEFTSGLQDSVISNNLFTGYTGGFGIYGYNYQGLTIHNNEFVGVTAGMHIDAFGNSGNLLVQANYVTGAKGMGFEFQGTADNLQFLDNWFEKPNLSSNYSANTSSFAFSLILDGSSDITVARNAVIAPDRSSDGTGCRVGFELGGDNTNVYDNYINGINHSAVDNDGKGTGSVVFHDNYMNDYRIAPSTSFPTPTRTFSAYNNGPDVQLTWDINRGHPGVNGTFGEDDVTTLPGGDKNIPVNIKAPTGLGASAKSSSSIQLAWAIHDNDQIGQIIEISTDGKTWNELTITSGISTKYTVAGLKSGTTYYFRVRSFNAAGFSAYTNVASAKTTGSPSSSSSTSSAPAPSTSGPTTPTTPTTVIKKKTVPTIGSTH